jgi:hypothetical protein
MCGHGQAACWSSATAGPTPCAAWPWPTSSATWALVRLAQAAAQAVLLVGVIATPTGATDDFDLAVERTADALGTGFVDVRAVSVTFPDDLADAVHPAQAWSDRITAAIVRHLQTPQP